MEDEEYIELDPTELILTFDEPEQKFTIQNLTLQYIAFKVISPNPIIFTFDIRQGVLDPCSSQEIKIKLNYISSMNFQSFESNNTINIFTLNVEGDQPQWNLMHTESIQKYLIHYIRYTLQLNFINGKYSSSKLPNNIIVAQKQNQELFNDDEKKFVINYIFQEYGRTETYTMSACLMTFTFPKLDKPLKGNVAIIQPQNNSFFFLSIYIPSQLSSTFPKYPIEPMSPQKIKIKVPQLEVPILQETKSAPIQQTNSQKKKLKLKKQISQGDSTKEQQQQQQQQQQIQQQQKQQLDQITEKNVSSLINQQLASIPEEGIIQIKDEKIEQPVQSPQKPRRQYQSESIPKSEMIQFSKETLQKHQRQLLKKKSTTEKIISEQAYNFTPIQIESNHPLQSQQNQSTNQFNQQIPIQPNFKRVAIFNAYQNIRKVLLFRDHSYLITVGDKDLIKVWSLNLNSEIGMIREHEDLKKCKIQELYEWPNMEERQFATLGSDWVLRIFSVEFMKLVKDLRIKEYSQLTSICFLADKDQVCLAGTPQKQFNIFGSKYPKFRYLKLFNLNSLKEILSYKVPCVEDQILSPIVYTDNEDVKHARLNNILVVSKQYQDRPDGELLFLMIDMDDQCSVILSLSFQQIAIYSVKNISYLPQKGSFVIVEKGDPKSYQQNKLLVLNVKQLQTEDGLKNGIVCKLFDEPSIIDDEVYVLAKQEYILKVGGDIVHMIDLKTGGQFNLQISTQLGGNPRNIIMAGKILRVDGEMIQILELQN